MAKNDNYEISDSLWGRIMQYASAVKESWGKDVDEYVEDVMDTDSRSDEETVFSTVLQDSAHSVEFVAHLVGSVFSNDYTKERIKELGSAIENTDAYKTSSETLNKLETTLSKASEQFMQEHPKVQTAFMATEEKLEEVKEYVTKEAETFAKNHPEITNDVKAALEIAMTVPAAKTVKVVSEARELSKLNKLDYEKPQGKELAKGIPLEVDKKSINLEKLEVTAEAKIGDEALFDTNQKARAQAHPATHALRHDVIRDKEAKIKLSNDKKIEKAEGEGNPLDDDTIAKLRSKESKPNATLAQSHAETAVIQRAYEQGLTKDADMFIKVNGKEVCGHCNSDTIAMAEKAGLKSITIHDYNAVDTKQSQKPIIYWEQGMKERERFDSFEDLKKAFPNVAEAPDHIKHAGVIEAERSSMNGMDVTLLGSGGAVLMRDNIEVSAQDQPIDTQTHAENLINTLYPHLDPTQSSNESTYEVCQEQEPSFSPQLENYLDQFASQNTQEYHNDMGMEIE